jgi:hypothetical protein
MFQQKGGAAALFVWAPLNLKMSGHSSRVARPNHSIAQLLNRHCSLYFFSPHALAHR